MIQVIQLPLSSPEVTRLKKWLHADEAILISSIANAALVKLEAELANSLSQSVEFPKFEDQAKEQWEQIRKLKNFLELLNKFRNDQQYAVIRLEPQNE